MIEAKPCYDGGVCRNDHLIEDLVEALGIAIVALRQYADGKARRHIATDALEELEELGLLTQVEMEAA